MGHHREAHEMSGPAVNRSDEPAERDATHEMLHALVRRVLADLVVHQEENSGPDLNDEEEKRDAAKVVPDRRMGADRHFLVSQERDEARNLEPLVEHPKNPGPDTDGTGAESRASLMPCLPA